MANYISATRTNYFHVTNEEKFKELMSRCCSETNFELWKNNETNAYAFGCYGTFDGLQTEEDVTREDCINNFAKELQALLPANEACIITNAGNEKLRYVGSEQTIITCDRIDYLSSQQATKQKVREILNNPNWEYNPE